MMGMSEAPFLSVSIVSHGQGRLVSSLLEDLGRPEWHCGRSFEVVVTLNIPEEESWLEGPFPYRLTVLRNKRPRGFGANHNAAFSVARGGMFAVVNPDIRLADFRIEPLIAALHDGTAGVCGPLVLAPGGTLEDSARRFPTFLRLARTKLRHQIAPDYVPTAEPLAVDWIAGMFMLFPAAAYGAVGGFDERYFMYYEDVDICRRLKHGGRDVLWVGSTALVHDASRASRRNLRHLRWHVRSLLRFLAATPR